MCRTVPQEHFFVPGIKYDEVISGMNSLSKNQRHWVTDKIIKGERVPKNNAVRKKKHFQYFHDFVQGTVHDYAVGIDRDIFYEKGFDSKARDAYGVCVSGL